ncbi:hypothetical protein F2Q68_00009679 [Brassica cretica]|uniref:Uncharacterized protein n=1 Tax=Brassica cretica TaxID=69181 RepID=A0A8S9KV75_BRACR|nr:hypothetical protein F2Q68_00009679 [Brassica cretica]
MHGFVSYQRFGKARSLCNDRNVHVLGRFGSSSVATDQPWLELGRFVVTELGSSSVATQRSSSVHAWSLCSDRAWLVRGPIAILELVRGWSRCVSVALGQPVFDSIET